MKKSRAWLLLFIFFILSQVSCTKGGDCGDDVRIDRLLPSTSLPAGNGFVIRGAGFGNDAVIRIGRLKLKPLAPLDVFDNHAFVLLPPGLLVAQAPETLLGPFDLTVDDGSCIARMEVDILGEVVPGGAGGLPFFFVPPIPPAFPASFSNQWPDVNDPNYSLSIQGNTNADGSGDVRTDFGSQEDHDNIDTLQFNPVSGYIQPPAVFLVINRGANHPGVKIPLDTLVGRYVDPARVDPKAKAAMWLISINTGKQRIIGLYN